MLLLVVGDKLQVDEEGSVKAGGDEVDLGELRQRLFVEGVFEVFQLVESDAMYLIILLSVFRNLCSPSRQTATRPHRRLPADG